MRDFFGQIHPNGGCAYALAMPHFQTLQKVGETKAKMNGISGGGGVKDTATKCVVVAPGDYNAAQAKAMALSRLGVRLMVFDNQMEADYFKARVEALTKSPALPVNELPLCGQHPGRGCGQKLSPVPLPL